MKLNIYKEFLLALGVSQYLVNIFMCVEYSIVFQPGVDPALPQAFQEATFTAGGGGARRRGSALQEGVQGEQECGKLYSSLK